MTEVLDAGKLVMMCDFDGTITEQDVGVELLKKFSKADWELIEQAFERGEVGIQENMQQQFDHVVEDASILLEHVRPIVTFRRGWDRLVRCCAALEIEVVVVSGGLDFYVDALLPKTTPMPKVYCLHTEFVDNRWRVFVPVSHSIDGSAGFKESVVEMYQAEGKRVWFAGNGTSDRGAASVADRVWAVEPLLGYCREAGLPVTEFADFDDIVRDVEHLLTGDPL